VRRRGDAGQELEAFGLPTALAVSIITVGEFRAGVLGAMDFETCTRRLAKLEIVIALEPLPTEA
jgi:hypothetical protein